MSMYSKILNSVLWNLVLYNLVSKEMLAIELRSLSICALSCFVFTRCLYSLLTHILHVRGGGKVTLTDTQACSCAFTLFIILLYIMF